MNKVRFCDFIDKYIERYRYSKRKGVTPFQNRGLLSWHHVFVDNYSNYVIEAYKYPIAIGYSCVNLGKVNKNTRSSFRVLDKVNMDLYGAKIQEVYS